MRAAAVLGVFESNPRAALAGEAKALKAGRCDFSFQGAFLATRSKSGALKISSCRELRSWLESLPPEQGRWVAVAIAARVALRVLPLVEMEAQRNRHFEILTFAVFFATALARIAAVYPIRANTADAFILAASPDGNAYAAFAAFHAADAAKAAKAADAANAAAAAAADNAAAAADADNTAIWEAVSRDAKFIASGGAARALACEPLWIGGEPDWSTQHWKLLQDALPRENDWQVWIDWCERRLKGLSDSEEVARQTAPASRMGLFHQLRQ